MPLKLNLRISQIGMILVIVPIVLQLVFVAWLANLLWQADMEKMHEMQARRILQAADDMYKVSYRTGYNLAQYITEGQKQQYINDFRAALTDIPGAVEKMEKAAEGDPEAKQKVAEMKPVWEEVQVRLGKISELMVEHPNLNTFYRIQAHRDYCDKFGDKLARWLIGFVRDARAVETTSPEKQKQIRQEQGFVLMVALIANIAMAFGLAWFFAREITNRLTVMTDNTKRLVEDKPLNPEQSGVVEIAQLDRVFHDMAHALKEAAQKERSIIKNASEVICVLDKEGRFSKLNPACLSVWQYESQELIGKSLLDIVDGQDKEKTSQALNKSQNSDQNTSFENRIIRQDGSAVETLWSIHWSKEEESVFCVAHDITERKELERLKQEFMAMVSHDMRTPLTSVLGTVKLLANGLYGELPDKATEKLNVVTRNIDRLVMLINDLLDIEKLEAGQMQLNKQSFPINQVLERSMQELEQYAAQHDIKLDLKINDIQVNADQDRLIQVIVNLLSNAIKFSPKNSLVKLSAEMVNGAVWVKVEDKGRGIPDSHKNIIFERFKQVQNSDGQRKTGTGLGLPICKQIIESHGGQIGVDSQEGQGSTFWFWIPAEDMSIALLDKLEKSIDEISHPLAQTGEKS